MSCSPNFSHISLRSHGDVFMFVEDGDEPADVEEDEEEDVSESLSEEFVFSVDSWSFSSFVLWKKVKDLIKVK